ncbi:tetratricopeptide repeat protein [Pontibacter sp. KCTC 32443]|uniref:tetratricopeptide repeat protein n=1 Tax=Pontibacter TaxID=323449 RepID=UPI00164D4F8F|nr:MULTISPECIES: tetratricopeptide repeat protein [Pontibacter]MBC5775284.1 tetratricopeptide repeat protein [Pontibacter sp. KCTC 32443]
MKYSPSTWWSVAGITPKHIKRYSLKPAALFLLIVIVCSSMTMPDPDNSMRRADKAYAKADFAEAAEWYQKVLEKEPENLQAMYRLGISYLEMREPRKAKLCLAKVFELDPRFGEKVIVNLAEALHQNYEFEEAKKFYQQEIYSTGRADWNYVEVIRKRLEECNAGQALLAQPSVAQVVNLGAAINSKEVEFVPILTGNDSTLLFTAHEAPEGPEQIRISRKVKGEWKASKEFLPATNTKMGHSIVTISPNGNQLYTYAAAEGLRSFDQAKGAWVNPKPMPIPLSQLANETSVHITESGEFAFFSSDRPGGYGGLDLYVSQRFPDGTWSAAINLGASINTPYDEDAAFVDATTKTLYFSSRGHNTMGGYDIFKAVMLDGAWQQVQNVGFPINSPHDDLYFTLDRNRQSAYFSSDRPDGMGALDIYQILFLK